MSHFQSPEAMRQFWRDVARSLRIVAAVLAAITCLILAVWCAVDREWAEATFFLVLAWWSESDFKGLRDNGACKHG